MDDRFMDPKWYDPEDEEFWNSGEDDRVRNEARIHLYKIAPGPGPGIVHAAFSFSRITPRSRPFYKHVKGKGYIVKHSIDEKWDCGWDRNGYYMRQEPKSIEPIHVILLDAHGYSPYKPIDIYLMVREVRDEWKEKSYDMLEDNCTDFVNEVLKRLTKMPQLLSMFHFPNVICTAREVIMNYE